MTRNEAILLIRDIDLCSTYLHLSEFEFCNSLLDKKDEFNFDELINFFQSLDIPYKVVSDFVSGDIEFDLISGEHSGDDWDNTIIYRNEDNSLGMYAWTEVCGICYDLKDYGKTWTERKETEEEIKEREEREERYKKYKEEYHDGLNKLLSDLAKNTLPNLVNTEQVVIKPMTSIHDQYVKALTADSDCKYKIDKDVKEEK